MKRNFYLYSFMVFIVLFVLMLIGIIIVNNKTVASDWMNFIFKDQSYLVTVFLLLFGIFYFKYDKNK